MSRFGWPNLLPAASSCSMPPALRLALVILLGLAGPWSSRSHLAPRQGGRAGRSHLPGQVRGLPHDRRGKLVGPDLKDVTARRDPQWLKAFIADPNKLFATDPTAQQLLVENNNVKMPASGLLTPRSTALVTFLGEGRLQRRLPGLKVSSPAGGAGPGRGSRCRPTYVYGPGSSGQRRTGVYRLPLRSGLGRFRRRSARPRSHPCRAALSRRRARLGPGQHRLPHHDRPVHEPPADAPGTGGPGRLLGPGDQGQVVAPPVTPGALTQNTGLLLAVGLGGVLALTVLLAIFWPRQRQSVSARLRNARLRA